MNWLKHTAKKLLRPAMPLAHSIGRALSGTPQVGQVQFGDLRRTRPISADFGADRGLPIDRFYIEAFLRKCAADIHRHVMEVGESRYTRQFGGAKVTKADILHVTDENPDATIVADLADAAHIADNLFDTAIVTQTLHLIFDPRAALRTLHRTLKPGGTLLMTVPGITPVAAGTRWGSTWYWSFTALSMQRLMQEAFGSNVEVTAHGNVLAATALLQGLATSELEEQELEHLDPSYPVIVTVRAVKT